MPPPAVAAPRESGGTPFVAAVSVLVFRGGRILALRRAAGRDAGPGAWEAVSGRVEKDEHPRDTAARECREETGLEVLIDPQPVAAYTAKRIQADMLVVVYRGASVEGDVALSTEHDQGAWMTIEEFAAACPFRPLVAAARLAASRPAPLAAAEAAVAPASHVILWEFQPLAGRETEFEAVYGPDGDWARLFWRSAGYLGTELLRAGDRYLTLDRWVSRQAFEEFRSRHAPDYDALDRRCAGLTRHEAPLGEFAAVPGDRHRPSRE